MKEVWKNVVGYEGVYEVSNLGRIRTHKNKTTYSTRHNTLRHWKQRVLKDKTPNGRDYRVALWKDGKHKDFLAHRLVAGAFIPKEKGKNCINHIDGNPKNNRVDNLEWCDYKYNNNHAFDNGLMTTNHEVILIEKSTGDELYFRSKSKAGKYIGKSHGYISEKIKKGTPENDKYFFKLV